MDKRRTTHGDVGLTIRTGPMPATDETGRRREPSSQAHGASSNELIAALDDIDGLQEAHIALSDGRRRSSLMQDRAQAIRYQRELATAADAYAATVMSTRRGELAVPNTGCAPFSCRSISRCPRRSEHRRRS